MGVLGVGFSEAPACSSDSVVRDSIFMVTELCRGGSLREKVLEQMVAGRKVLIQLSTLDMELLGSPLGVLCCGRRCWSRWAARPQGAVT